MNPNQLPSNIQDQQQLQRKNSIASQQNRIQQQNAQRLQLRKKQDAKSIFIENVDYKSTRQQLTIIFEDCGQIDRVTIVKDKFTNQPKGCAYLSFVEEESVEMALNLSGTKLRGRCIRVQRKRTNIVGMGKDNKARFFNQVVMKLANKGGVFRGKSRGRGRGQ